MRHIFAFESKKCKYDRNRIRAVVSAIIFSDKNRFSEEIFTKKIAARAVGLKRHYFRGKYHDNTAQDNSCRKWECNLCAIFLLFHRIIPILWRDLYASIRTCDCLFCLFI